MSERPIPIDDLGTEHANILFYSSPLDHSTDHACTRLLAPDGSPDQCLLITYTRPPDKKLKLLRSDSSGAETTQGVIIVGGQSRSSAADTNISPPRPGGPVIETVTEPTDLTGLGIAISKFLDAWGASNGEFTMCFDSLTPLLVYVSVDRSYRFLHTLTAQITAHGATAHYHIDPSAHSAKAVSTLASLFDLVVECTDTGEITPVNP